MKLIPTSEQAAIISAAISCDTSLMISAMAGTAKTTTLQMVAEALPAEPALALAFNTRIKKELEKRFPPHFKILTMNGLGHAAWSRAIGKRLDLQERKLGNLITATFKAASFRSSMEDWGAVKDLITSAMNVGLIPRGFSQKGLIEDTNDNWMDSCENFAIKPVHVEFAREVLIESIKQGFAGIISFDDQIYLSCQPAGTKVLVHAPGGWREEDISNIRSGDKVISFNRTGGHKTSVFTGLHNHASVVEGVGSRSYTGLLYEIMAGNFRTFATNEHKWLVRFPPDFRRREMYFTYLMSKDGSFKIGMTQVRSVRPDSSDGFGLAVRCNQEGAQHAWILGVHSSLQEAVIEEAKIVAEFGITDKSFVSEMGKLIHEMQRNRIDIKTRAITCLNQYTRDIRFPFWAKNQTRAFASNFILESCNLIDGIMQVPTFVNAREPRWETLYLNKIPAVNIPVFSLKVATTGLYVADRILTHNSLFGGVFPRYNLVLVDEAQDLSPINHLQVKRSAAGRLIVAGDRLQSIYAFRGADASSMEKLRTLRADWIDLPLTVTFRCPRAVVARQQDHAVGFTAAPSNHEGKVLRLPINGAVSWEWADIPWGAASCAVLCRNNAPLVALAFKLLRRNVGVIMLGRDIGRGLIALSKKLLPNSALDVADSEAKINDWIDSETSIAMANKQTARADRVRDQGESLLAVLKSDGVRCAGDLRTNLETLFARSHGQITLSTIHKAKGLEFDTVVHLDSWRIPSKWARLAGPDSIAWSQEMNLRYVCETRARQTLVLADMETFT